MAEADDDKVRERYRALGRDEPPPELDARSLAPARRAAARPRRRWVLPVSIAAVVVLSVSVALQVERERSDLARQLAAPAESGKAPAPAASPVAPPAPAPAAPAASDNLMRAPELERKQEQAPARGAAKAGRLSGQSVESSPEQWLARIAELRRAGRNDEADRQLAEFRRLFPDYRIPDAMQKEIEPR
jgi:hypothetical protein